MKARMIDMAKAWVGTAEFILKPWNYASDELVVLCMHSTPKSHQANFAGIVAFILKSFKALDPAHLSAYFSGGMQSGPYVLFTFDDGLKNNLYATEILDSQGVKALFFVVPDFIQADDQMAYYRRNIRNIIDADFDKEMEDVTAMSIVDIRGLLQRGHLVGSHSQTHLLRAASSAEIIEQEVVDSKHWLQENMKVDIESFCSPINTNFSISAWAKQAIAQHYVFHFTTFPGLHTTQRNPQLIFRRNIEVNWSVGKIKYALGKVDLRRWWAEIQRFRQL